MLTPLSIDLRTDYDKYNDNEYQAVSYASEDMRIEVKPSGYESYTVYGLLHIPKKELAVRYKIVYSGWPKASGYYSTTGKVYTGVEKIEQVFEKHRDFLTKRLDVNVCGSTIRWLKHYLEHHDNMHQIMAITYYPYFRVYFYF